MKSIYVFGVLVLFAACIQKYSPPIQPAYTNNLVVEGSLNSGQGPALLTISRSNYLDSVAMLLETGATVVVQGDDSSNYPLTEITFGNYGAQDLTLDSNKTYRLKITTSNGEQYVSDFVHIVPNPPIDSVSYQFNTDSSVGIWVNTQNPQGNTRYYQWEYTETWEFHSAYGASLKFDSVLGPQGLTVSLSPPTVYSFAIPEIDTSIYICWQSAASTQLLIGSSAALSADAISLPLTNIPAGSQKLSVMYSINVSQFGWSKDGYQFLQAMKNNTEGIGSIFGPLPTQLASNIHCISDPTKKVVGYFNVSPTQQKRLFISAADLPGWKYDPGCLLEIIDNDPDSILKYASGLLPVAPKDTKPIPFSVYLQILTFTASPAACVDCRLTGTNVKPSFWP